MRDKQIEEMARTICNCYNSGYCKMHGNSCDLKCRSGWNALGIYKAGYRKASEVAREIFEEIERAFFDYDKSLSQDPMLSAIVRTTATLAINDMFCKIAKLKKKYTEGEG
jgi:hypothetical protein